MSFFFKLSKYVSVPILSEWLRLNDVVLLDSALGSNEMSILNYWLKSFSDLISMSLFCDDFTLSFGLFLWSRKHGLNCSKLMLDTEMVDNSLNLATQNDKVDYFNAIKRIKLGISFERVTQLPINHIEEVNAGYSFNDGISSYAYLFTNLRICSLNCCSPLTDAHIIEISHHCPHLTRLSINEKLPDGILSILVHLRNLQHFEYSRYCTKTIEARELSIFILHCKCHLQTFTVCNIFNPMVIFYCGSQLQELELSFEYKDEVLLYSNLPTNMTKLDCRVRENLDLIPFITSYLCLQTLRMPQSRLDDHQIQLISSSLRLITTLHIDVYTNSGLIMISKAYPNMKDLSVNGGKYIDDIAVMCVANNCKKLKCLTCVHFKISDKSLFLIGDHCKRLSSIYLMWCDNITENGLQYMLKWLPITYYLVKGCGEMIDRSHYN